MSDFSAVDRASDPRRLVEFLDESAVGLGAMKHYMAAAHAQPTPDGPILDLGCGAGHDLDLLAAVGVAAIGVDPSAVMLEAAAARSKTSLVRAAGEQLPFRDASFAGCRIERVLMHVAEPEVVLAEAVRCVRPSGLLTIFEPDWSALHVDGVSPSAAGWLSNARHPSIGRGLGALLARADCTVVDRVEERSWWSFADFERITNLDVNVERAVTAGRIARADASRWTTEVRERAAAGTFRAEMVKLCWVATKVDARQTT
jgi:ubiquinone/menaquinone biosynthesis C-methylase UbiE